MSEVAVKGVELPRRLRWGTVGYEAIAVGLFALAAYPAAVGLVRLWIERPEYSHGFLMVPAAVWLAYEKRHALAAAEARPSLGGALVLGLGMAILLAGQMLAWPVLASYGLVLALAALVWGLRGWGTLKPLLPSLVALALACPLPGRIQMALTWPLKRLASELATGMLDLLGIGAALEGNLIYLQGFEKLWIADACSGIRSLISLLALVILGALMFRPRWPMVLAALVSCVPIAVFVNALRIALTGYLSVRVDPSLAQGFFHLFEGFGMFVFAGLLLWGWLALLSRLFPRGTA